MTGTGTGPSTAAPAADAAAAEAPGDRAQAGAGGSSLGRFLPGDDGSRLVEVRLLGLPLHLMRASREHHDGLMREFRILALSGQVSADEAPARLVELVRVLGEQYGATRERRDAELDAAIAAGLETIDQVDRVPASAAAAAVALQEMLDDADDYCRDAVLFTVPRPAAVRRFGEWYIGQFVDQVAGADPVPWDGPLRVEG